HEAGLEEAVRVAGGPGELIAALPRPGVAVAVGPSGGEAGREDLPGQHGVVDPLPREGIDRPARVADAGPAVALGRLAAGGGRRVRNQGAIALRVAKGRRSVALDEEGIEERPECPRGERAEPGADPGRGVIEPWKDPEIAVQPLEKFESDDLLGQ